MKEHLKTDLFNQKVNIERMKKRNESEPMYFYNESEFGNIEDVIMYFFEGDDDEINALPDDYTIDVYECQLHPVIDVDNFPFIDVAENLIDVQSEEGEEIDELADALRQCLDLEKLRPLVPNLWHPKNKVKITKQNLIDKSVG